MQRIIFLVDMNAFFIGCEMTRNAELKGKPAAVAGDPKRRSGIILAANYDARKFGVKTTMVINEAMKLCPSLILVPPDHSFYESKSKEVMDILSTYSPLVEQNSIDEAWVDLTGCETLFGEPLEIAARIMDDIRNQLDLWCSIGISQNKFLAKMASDMKKPLGITEVWEKDIKEKIWPLPIREMYGIGKQTEKKLGNIAIFTIGDIARCDKALLTKLLGKSGEELHRLSNGIDLSPVSEERHRECKSITRSRTLPQDTNDLEHAKTVLMKLAEEIGMEARKYGIKGKTISIEIKYGDFQSITRQKSIKYTNLTRNIYETGIEVLTANWNVNRPVRLLGIRLTNFQGSTSEQMSLFDLGELEVNDEKEEKIENAMDRIRERYGKDKVLRAKVMEN